MKDLLRERTEGSGISKMDKNLKIHFLSYVQHEKNGSKNASDNTNTRSRYNNVHEVSKNNDICKVNKLI